MADWDDAERQYRRELQRRLQRAGEVIKDQAVELAPHFVREGYRTHYMDDHGDMVVEIGNPSYLAGIFEVGAMMRERTIVPKNGKALAFFWKKIGQDMVLAKVHLKARFQRPWAPLRRSLNLRQGEVQEIIAGE